MDVTGASFMGRDCTHEVSQTAATGVRLPAAAFMDAVYQKPMGIGSPVWT
jgi:hypothetical protein